ncbi:MAG: hypothetical protein LCH88_16325 [Proteobacteria bacterium]|nr:hypothetical protein [Pseudomonadota bacterium]
MSFLVARLRAAVPAWALAYAALWSVALVALHLEAPLQALAGCAADTEAPLPLWTCGEGLGSTLAGALVNSALLTVVWAPALVAAAFVRPDAIPLAAVAFGSHLVGLGSVMAMVARGVRLVMRRFAVA